MKKEMNFKRVLLCAIFMITSFGVFAYSSETDSISIESDTVTAIKAETVDTLEIIMEDVANAIVFVESGGNLRAVNGSCCGPMQISPGMVKACNQIMKKNGESYRFTLNDRYNLEKSKWMFKVFNKEYNKSFNLSKAIRSWNGGLGYTIKGTQKYFNKVMKYYNAHKTV